MKDFDIEAELSSEEYKNELRKFYSMQKSLIHCLLFCYNDSSRGNQEEKNFFLRMIDDISQSVISIQVLISEGIMNTCRRELRYLVELSLKSCLIVNKNSKETFEKRVDDYDSLLNNSNINPINSLILEYFNEEQNVEFKTEVKRIYGYLSKYSHSTSHQIHERLLNAQKGRTIGFEGIEEIKKLNSEIEKVFTIVLVFIFHSVDKSIVGDYIVESNGDSIKWYFSDSKFISLIDSKFDYKSERRNKLSELLEKRLKMTKF